MFQLHLTATPYFISSSTSELAQSFALNNLLFSSLVTGDFCFISKVLLSSKTQTFQTLILHSFHFLLNNHCYFVLNSFTLILLLQNSFSRLCQVNSLASLTYSFSVSNFFLALRSHLIFRFFAVLSYF